MEILVLGLPRTGTQSLADALKILGYKNIYHMREVGINQHQRFWIAALEAKFEGKGKPFGREEFDSFLSSFDCVSDYPASIFPAELINAYPDAKIILTTRSEDAWYDSMMKTIWHAWSAKDAKPSAMRPLADKYQTLLWDGDFPKHGRDFFEKHNEFVRSIAPKEKFLEYEVKEGWEKLCAFLGKDVPLVPFPRSDDWVEYKKLHFGE